MIKTLYGAAAAILIVIFCVGLSALVGGTLEWTPELIYGVGGALAIAAMCAGGAYLASR